MSVTASHNPRLPVAAFVLTLLGLVALLVTPIGVRQHVDRLHAEIDEKVEQSREKVFQAAGSAREIQSYVYRLYFLSGAKTRIVSLEQLDQMEQEWRDRNADDSALDAGGEAALQHWKRGKAVLYQWFDAYKDPNHLPDAQDSETVERNDALLTQAMNELKMAREAIEARQKSLRQEIDSIHRWQIRITVPLTLICLLLAALSWRNLASLQRAWIREQEVTARLEVAIQETNHRIKNNLQVVSSLLDMQMIEAEEAIPKAALKGIVQQVKAVAAVHDFLSKERRETRVQGDQMLAKLVELVAQPAGLLVRLEAEAVGLEVKQATALALITNELLLNAGKHGATEAMVCIRSEGNTATLQVTDNGPGFPPSFDPDRDSNLGIALVSTLARHDLDGEVVFQTRDGAFIEITFPLQVHAENKEPLKK